jgi:subtilase family serine protease
MNISGVRRGLIVLASAVSVLYSQDNQQPKTLLTAPLHRAFGNAIRQHRSLQVPFTQLPNNAACLVDYGTTCYTPREISRAYGLEPLEEAGVNGEGQTIVIVVSFGSPTLATDLKTFDAQFGLPDPPSLQILAPLGTVPFDPTVMDQLIWAGETELDVEWAHALAPRANIVVLTSPVDETQGLQGLPEFLQLEQYALDHHLGQIISQSWGTAENSLFDAAGKELMNQFEAFYQQAAAEHVTVLAAAGDTGTQNVDANGTPYTFPTVLFPASSPFVMAVGGTTLNLDANNDYQSETVWNDSSTQAGASGGGVSQYFVEPSYQSTLPPSTRAQLSGGRGIPDVAFNADDNTPVWVYFGFFPDTTQNNFYAAGSGTSAATAQWAGIVADANQLAGGPLGLLNPTIYAIGAGGIQTYFFHDITVGNNAYGGLPGYQATPGYDIASGWGTPKLQALLWELLNARY